MLIGRSHATQGTSLQLACVAGTGTLAIEKAYFGNPGQGLRQGRFVTQGGGKYGTEVFWEAPRPSHFPRDPNCQFSIDRHVAFRGDLRLTVAPSHVLTARPQHRRHHPPGTVPRRGALRPLQLHPARLSARRLQLHHHSGRGVPRHHDGASRRAHTRARKGCDREEERAGGRAEIHPPLGCRHTDPGLTNGFPDRCRPVSMTATRHRRVTRSTTQT